MCENVISHHYATAAARKCYRYAAAQAMTHTPTLSRRQEMYAWAARAGAATVISNLDPDGAVFTSRTDVNET